MKLKKKINLASPALMEAVLQKFIIILFVTETLQFDELLISLMFCEL